MPRQNDIHTSKLQKHQFFITYENITFDHINMIMPFKVPHSHT